MTVFLFCFKQKKLYCFTLHCHYFGPTFYLLVGLRMYSGEVGGGGILSIVKLTSSYGLAMGAEQIIDEGHQGDKEVVYKCAVCGTAWLHWVCYLVYCSICMCR